MCYPTSLSNSEDKRSYSSLNLFYFILKLFFERKKKLDQWSNELAMCIPTGRSRLENKIITMW